jgi:hypothetical protein
VIVFSVIVFLVIDFARRLFRSFRLVEDRMLLLSYFSGFYASVVPKLQPVVNHAAIATAAEITPLSGAPM